MDDNKRAAKRQRVLKDGRAVTVLDGTFDVTVRDISETGAKLLCDTPLALPDTFRLVMLSEGTIRPVKVVWRKPGSLGITFEGESKPSVLRRI